MCFAPQRRAFFGNSTHFHKCSDAEFFWSILSLKACNLGPDGSAPAALASPLFHPPEPQNVGKTQRFATFSTFSRAWIFFLLTLSLLWSSSSFFSLLGILPTSAASSALIDRSMASASKLPSVNKPEKLPEGPRATEAHGPTAEAFADDSSRSGPAAHPTWSRWSRIRAAGTAWGGRQRSQKSQASTFGEWLQWLVHIEAIQPISWRWRPRRCPGDGCGRNAATTRRGHAANGDGGQGEWGLLDLGWQTC